MPKRQKRIRYKKYQILNTTSTNNESKQQTKISNNNGMLTLLAPETTEKALDLPSTKESLQQTAVQIYSAKLLNLNKKFDEFKKNSNRNGNNHQTVKIKDLKSIECFFIDTQASFFIKNNQTSTGDEFDSSQFDEYEAERRKILATTNVQDEWTRQNAFAAGLFKLLFFIFK
jgi:hypothetical protein